MNAFIAPGSVPSFSVVRIGTEHLDFAVAYVTEQLPSQARVSTTNLAAICVSLARCHMLIGKIRIA